MKLKSLLEGFAWERKPGQPLPTLKDTTKAHALNEQEGVEFDYDYYIKQVEGLIEATEEVEYELVQTLDSLADDDEVYGLVSNAADQAANQVRRYFAGAQKQLEGLQRLLDNAKQRKSFNP